jgi:hypothetical protein
LISKNAKASETNLDAPLFCRITQSTRKRLDSYVYDKFGTTYALSRIVNDILSDYLDTQPHPAHAHQKREAFRSLQKIRGFFISYPEFEGVERVIDHDVKQKIGEYFGLDNRTRKKYFDAMVELDILRNPQPVQGGRRVIYDIDLSPLGIKVPDVEVRP